MLKFLKAEAFNVRNVILILLFLVHVVWVTNHARLHFERVINPWKGGGYAMYTNVAPQPRIEVYTSNTLPVEMSRETSIRVEPPMIGLLLGSQEITNPNRFFRCRMLTKRQLKIFSENYVNRLKKFSVIKISERALVPASMSVERTDKVYLQFNTHNDNLYYEGTICGKETRGFWPV